MNSNPCDCKHATKVSNGCRFNCALCNTFISAIDGKAAIKDPTLGGLHQTYPTSIMDNLLSKDATLPVNHRVPKSYIAFRTMLIDWLNIIKSRFSLSNETFHIGVRYMDYILSQKEYHQSKYQLIALSCLIIAAKFDELDMNIPFPEDFTRIAKLPFKNFVISQCEMLLLEILGWKLKVATVNSVGHCLLSQGVLFDDDIVVRDNAAPKVAHAMLLTKVVEFLIDYSVRGKFAFMDQGRLAVVLILCGRKAVGVKDVWNDKLEEMTSYNWKDLKDLFNLISKEYEEEIEYCIENAEQLIEEPPTKELKVEPEEVPVENQKENAGSLVWLKMSGLGKVPQSEVEELKEWNKRFVAGKVKAPLSLSQRLNISG